MRAAVHRLNQSMVWNYFDREGSSAVCKRCGRKLSIKGGSTSSLRAHLRQVHCILLTDSRNNDASDSELVESSESQPKVPIKKQRFQQSTIEKCLKKAEYDSIDVVLAKLVAIDGFSMNAIVHSEFLRAAFLERGFTMPKCPSSLTKILNNHSSDLKQQMTDNFRVMIERGQRFSFMIDEWTSRRRRRYMSISCNDGEELHQLGMVRLFGRLTAENIADVFNRKLEEFGLSVEKHAVAVVTDGASAMNRMGSVLIPCFHQVCLAHGIHLAVCNVLYHAKITDTDTDESDCETSDESDDFETDDDILGSESLQLTGQILPTIKKVRQLSRYFRKSSLKDEVLQKYVKQELGYELGLLIDIKIRWNSLYDMISRFVKLKNCLLKASLDLTDVPATLTENEWDLLENLALLLEPVKIGVEALGKRDATLRTADGINSFMLKKVSQIPGPLATALYDEMLKYITERRNDDLTSQLKYLTRPASLHETCELQFQAMPSRGNLEKSLKRIWSRLFIESSEQTTEIEAFSQHDPEAVKPNTTRLRDELHQSIVEATTTSTTSSQDQSVLRKEMNLFEATNCLPKNLKLIRDAIITVSPTTVEVERSFSISGGFVSKVRSRLGDTTIDSLQFLKGYYSK